MRVIDYDQKDKNTGNTENQMAVDEAMRKNYGNIQQAYEEGFAASDGVRGETVETAGRVKTTEKADESKPMRVPETIENENPGLADS